VLSQAQWLLQGVTEQVPLLPSVKKPLRVIQAQPLQERPNAQELQSD
jgi:hypothetical protein